tara:strand:- start:437 stop:682 length:246 start_codon:yes stop_codon:yes gene_type:complete
MGKQRERNRPKPPPLKRPLEDVLEQWQRLGRSNANCQDILDCVEHEFGEHARAMKNLRIGQKKFSLVCREIEERLGSFIEA